MSFNWAMMFCSMFLRDVLDLVLRQPLGHLLHVLAHGLDDLGQRHRAPFLAQQREDGVDLRDKLRLFAAGEPDGLQVVLVQPLRRQDAVQQHRALVDLKLGAAQLLEAGREHGQQPFHLSSRGWANSRSNSSFALMSLTTASRCSLASPARGRRECPSGRFHVPLRLFQRPGDRIGHVVAALAAAVAAVAGLEISGRALCFGRQLILLRGQSLGVAAAGGAVLNVALRLKQLIDELEQILVEGELRLGFGWRGQHPEEGLQVLIDLRLPVQGAGELVFLEQPNDFLQPLVDPPLTALFQRRGR